MLKESSNGKDFTLNFPKGKSLYDVDWLGFISRKKKVIIAKFIFDKLDTIKLKPYCTSCNKQITYSYFKALYSRVIVDDNIKEKIPKSQTLPQTLRGKNGLSASSLSLVDSRTIVIKDFTFMGLAPGKCQNTLIFICRYID